MIQSLRKMHRAPLAEDALQRTSYVSALAHIHDMTETRCSVLSYSCPGVKWYRPLPTRLRMGAH